MVRIQELLVYRNFEQKELFENMVLILNRYNDDDYNKEEMVSLLYQCVNELIELAVSHGFEGNIWNTFLTFLLVNHENAYSCSCEIVGQINGTINTLVMHDFTILQQLFHCDFEQVERTLGVRCLSMIKNYRNMQQNQKLVNQRIRDRINELSVHLTKASSPEQFMEVVTLFYRDYGVGKFGLHKAFRVVHSAEAVKIKPITNTEHVYLDQLIGYEIQKKKLIDNTKAFVEGRKANNCLMFGDAGTGKSSSVKAILNEFYSQGLRMIEVYKHQFQDLPSIIEQVKNRNYKFIIYMDDLSFEEFEVEYKYLKAVIEGGLEKRPDNVLIYATSNRRHLVREKFSDKEERRDDLHASDTVQEKLSLVARFGVTIFFSAPAPKEFKHIVETLAKRHGISMPLEELYLEANKWELSHGGLSGRTAQQFITHLLGSEES